MTLRVASFNVQKRPSERPAHLRSRMAAVASLIRSIRPDVVCLQEVLPEGYPILVEKLAPREAVFHPREDGFRTGEAVPILLLSDRFSAVRSDRFWLSPTPDQPSIAWRARCHRLAGVLGIRPAEAEGPCIWIVNLHLDHRSRESRARSLDLLRSRLLAYGLGAQDEVLLCGDFNMRPKDPLLARLQKGRPRFLDAASIVPEPTRRLPTFEGWSPLRLGRGRIDYCYHTPGLRCTDYGVVPAKLHGPRLSDHNPVRIGFDLRPAPVTEPPQ